MMKEATTWAEDNPKIERQVLKALQYLVHCQNEMESLNAEGCAILENLINARDACEIAIAECSED